nr:hypothetical protein [Tanacetum cinerariifolium]
GIVVIALISCLMRGDARQEHSVERDDDVLEETVSKNILEVVVEKTKKKRKKKVAEDASGSTFPPKRLREDYHVITSNIEGKSLAAICGLVPDGSSVSSETFLPSLRYVVSSDDSYHSGSCSEVKSFVRSPAADVPVTTVAVTTTVTADASAVLPPKVRIKSKNLEIFGDSASAGKANVNDAGCLEVEVRMRAKHTLEQKDRLEDKCSKQTTLLSERDAEIAHLKSLLYLKESKVVENIRLHGQLYVVEAADAAKGNELRDLKERNFLQILHDELSSKVTSLEAKRDMLANQSSEYLQALGQAIGCVVNKGIHDGLTTRVDHRKAGRDLSVIEAYDPSVQARYIDAVNAFSIVDFSLLSELRSMWIPVFDVSYSSPEYLQALGQAIGCVVNKGIHDGLKARVDHRKAERDLSVIEAYDPFVQARYIDAVNAFSIVDFSLLSDLRSMWIPVFDVSYSLILLSFSYIR